MLTLYPELEPFQTHLLQREPLCNGTHHQIYIEQCGNPDGIPVIFLHGGPGSGCRPQHRRYFDPQHFHIILFDQRGCGRSVPAGELENNDTLHLIEDMEVIRKLLKVDDWVLFGGSWGATLALCYARQYPKHVTAMILRGVFLGRKSDIDWVYAEGGASRIFADAWQELTAELPAFAKTRPLNYFHQQLQAQDPAQQMQAALTLQRWEATIVMMRDVPYQADPDRDPGPLAHARIQLHFAINECFIRETPILNNVKDLQAIPIQIIQGRYDMVCPVQQAWELKQMLPDATLNIVPLAGHAAGEPALIDALIKATNYLAEHQ